MTGQFILILAMNKHQLIINKTSIKAFDYFDDIYGTKAIKICSLLEKFHINIVYVSDAKNLDHVDFKPYDPMASYVEKNRTSAESTIAEILVDETVLSYLCLNDQELHAALAHEIGHIIVFFLKHKLSLSQQEVEWICDEYVCDMGLKDNLMSLLTKLTFSGLYPEWQTKQLRDRLALVTSYITNDIQ